MFRQAVITLAIEENGAVRLCTLLLDLLRLLINPVADEPQFVDVITLAFLRLKANYFSFFIFLLDVLRRAAIDLSDFRESITVKSKESEHFICV